MGQKLVGWGLPLLLGVLLVAFGVSVLRQHESARIEEEGRIAALKRIADDGASRQREVEKNVKKVNDPLLAHASPGPGSEIVNEQEWTRQLKVFTDATLSDLSTFDRVFGASGLKEPNLSINPSAATASQNDENHRKWHRRDLDLYRGHTKDRDEIRPLAEEFLAACIDSVFPGLSPPVTYTQLTKLGGDALAEGSLDPLVLAYYAEFVTGTPKLRYRTEPVVAEALKRLRESSYPVAVEVRLRSRLQYAGSRATESDPIGRHIAFHRVVARWLIEESRSPGQARSVYRRLKYLMASPSASFHSLAKLVLLEKSIDPWLLHLILGSQAETTAWDLRGTGTASTVSEVQWKWFREHLQTASIHYRRAWMLHPDRPEAATAMIKVAYTGDEPVPTPADWLTKAVAAEFDHMNAYHDYAFSLTSRWGGAPPLLLGFGAQCLGTGRFDTRVPLYGVTILNRLVEWEGIAPGELFREQPFAQALAADMTRRWKQAINEAATSGRPVYTDHGEVEQLLQFYLDHGDIPAARQLALEIPPSLPLRRLRDGAASKEYVLTRLLASSEDLRPVVADLERRLFTEPIKEGGGDDSGPIEAGLARLTKAGDDAARFAQLLQGVRQERQAWLSGEWISYSPQQMLQQLSIHADEYALNDDGSLLEIFSSELGANTPQMGVAFPLPFDPPLEIEVRMDSDAEADTQEGSGVYWAPRRPRPRIDSPERREAAELDEAGHPFFGYKYLPGLSRVIMQLGLRPPPLQDHGAKGVPPLAPIHVRLWRRRFEFHLDSQSFAGDLRADLATDSFLFLGEPYFDGRTRYWEPSRGRIRIAEIRVRRLPDPSPPLESAPYEERLAYWKQRAESDPSDRLAVRQVAELVLEQSPGDALMILDGLESGNPRLNEVRLLRARALIDLGRYDEARPLCKTEFDFRPELRALAGPAFERLEILARGPDSKQLKEFVEREKPMVLPSYSVNTFRRETDAVLALEILKQFRSGDEVRESEYRAKLNEMANSYRDAIRLANPGPRRERLEASFKRDLNEFQDFKSSPKPVQSPVKN